ncbi:cytochrome P450 71A1-like [Prosopis cineraria]|uniref:cytochrome P450 71A1-like n=1 Tax=Prosopis cineraria TaxID=364024 RepID=UPI0024105B75|nr:cytochrome P450 71A1-like [Prosopis cineraria]
MMENRSSVRYTKKKSLLHILLHLHDDGKFDNSFSQNDLKSILMDMLVGGSDISSATMEWAMVELVKNPTKMQKAKEELRHVVGNKSKRRRARHKPNELLKMFGQRILRLHLPTRLLAPRVPRSDVNIGGVLFKPKQSTEQ